VSPTLYTVGHSTRSFAALLAILKAHRIERLADVRSHPRSRRNPQFNREALAESLARSGITYRGYRDLGGHRRPRPESRNMGLTNAGFRGYADHMETAAFQQALDQLLRDGAESRTAVLCAEADWRRCHRQYLADALLARGAEVVHLLDEGPGETHMLSRNARIVEGRPHYPAEQERLF
jgi:uncharacterized protein (DUF488 family)